MVCHGFTILHKHTTNSKTTSITLNLKGFCKIWQNKEWCLGKSLLQLIKNILLCFAPNERNILLCEFIQGASDGVKIFHKAAIKTRKTMKTLDLANDVGVGQL
jgi:hypothetical protein